MVGPRRPRESSRGQRRLSRQPHVSLPLIPSAAAKYCLVLSTAPTRKVALRLARQIVEKKLAACVSVIPGAVSHYRWKGKIEKSKEAVLLIKTSRPLFSSLCRLLKKNHPYEVPEMLALPVLRGWPDYLAWMDEVLKAD
ncbi:MAG: divalent-cation tolerance protein CutA [Candidatus Omnitrophica bacterium]|nr:divalent-cation tolerance protein CutA [Candidatus Omnitrophota bacterium]